MGGRAVVIGIGNEFRRDDGAGPLVLTRLARLVPPGVELVASDGDPARIIEAWDGAALAIVVDAVRADPAVPGRVHRLVLDHDDLPPGGEVSSHGLGLDGAIGLARAVGRLPRRLIVHAVEAGDVSLGTGLTAAVASATDALAEAVLRDLALGEPLAEQEQGPMAPPDRTNAACARRAPAPMLGGDSESAVTEPSRGAEG